MKAQTKVKHSQKITRLENVYRWLLLVIFGGIVLHAPLSVGFGVLFPEFDLIIKSWKEILMLVALVLAVYIIQQRGLWRMLWDDVVVKILCIYSALHIVLLPIIWQGVQPSLAGLAIDLRYVLFFLLVYILTRIAPVSRRSIIKVVGLGGLVVAMFALLQVTVLPRDILTGIGYDQQTTIAPYLTVDQNPDYVRINSTLRGPNPLGAYAVIILSLLLAYLIKKRRTYDMAGWISIALLAIGSGIALWASYSRSALVAGGVALGTILLITLGRGLSRRTWVLTAVIVFAIVGGLFAARDTSFVSHVILHENPVEGNNVNSNEGHVESLVDGAERMARQPIGAGVGSTGSASLLGDEPLIIENQYLFIAHESGWAGLFIFGLLFGVILWRLYGRRDDWLALAVFASGIGLAAIGLLLPVWVDDTVAIIWWGLAAVALAGKATYVRHSTK